MSSASKQNDDECPVCFERFDTKCASTCAMRIAPSRSRTVIRKKDSGSSVARAAFERKKTFFPCGHCTCLSCFRKCERCPMCRVDKEGNSAEDQKRRGESPSAAEASRSVSVRRVTFQGPVGHPFENLNVALFGPNLPIPLQEMLPNAIADHLGLEIGRDGVSLLRARRGDGPHAHPDRLTQHP